MTQLEYIAYLKRQYDIDVWRPHRKGKETPVFWSGAQAFADGELIEKDWTQEKFDGWLMGFLALYAQLAAASRTLKGK